MTAAQRAAEKYLANLLERGILTPPILMEILSEYAGHFDDPGEALEQLPIKDLLAMIDRADRKEALHEQTKQR